MKNKSDVLVVGAGIAGLANAWAAARRGFSVTVLESSRMAEGATVQNFGMVWPIGQTPGLPLEIALKSRALWLEFLQATNIWHRECGSLFLFTKDDEVAVAEEFCERGSGYDVKMITASEICQRSPLARRDKIKAGMSSGTELNVDPRISCRVLADWLQESYDVEIHFAQPAAWCDETGTIIAQDGRKFSAERVLLCQGADARLLFPEAFDCPRLTRCKLHMMRTRPVNFDPGPMIASGLTLRHYAAFDHCPSIHALRERVAKETPELDQYGIHVMISSSSTGHLVLGDSHQYGEDIAPFQSEMIDDLILRELHEIVTLPDDPLDQRWHGIYYKRRKSVCFLAKPSPGVRIFNGMGGHGMTMSFGLADRLWDDWDSPELLEGISECAISPENKEKANQLEI